MDESGFIIAYGACDFACVVAKVIGIINLIIPILASIAIIIFVWGGIRYIYTAGEEGQGQAREILLWGLVALFVLFCIFGILRILTNTFLR